jgi:hypothetical protein
MSVSVANYGFVVAWRCSTFDTFASGEKLALEVNVCISALCRLLHVVYLLSRYISSPHAILCCSYRSNSSRSCCYPATAVQRKGTKSKHGMCTTKYSTSHNCPACSHQAPTTTPCSLCLKLYLTLTSNFISAARYAVANAV